MLELSRRALSITWHPPHVAAECERAGGASGAGSTWRPERLDVAMRAFDVAAADPVDGAPVLAGVVVGELDGWSWLGVWVWGRDCGGGHRAPPEAVFVAAGPVWVCFQPR